MAAHCLRRAGDRGLPRLIGRDGSGPAAAPTPRWPDGRVNLGSTPDQKGFWEIRPGLGGTPRAADIPLQPWARALAAYRHLAHRSASAARALQAGRRAGVLQRAGLRDRGRPGGAADLHPQHRRRALVARDLHGRAAASHRRRPAALLLRPLGRALGRRHAGGGHRGLQREAVAGGRLPHHRAAASHRARSRGPTCGRCPTKPRSTTPAPTPPRGRSSGRSPPSRSPQWIPGGEIFEYICQGE